MGKKFAINFLFATAFGVAYYLLLLFLHKVAFVNALPDSTSLLRWDAAVYRDIMLHDYSYPDPQINNTGCYILFPLLWRLTHLSVAGICIVNWLLFSAGFALLTAMYDVKSEQKMLWLSFPTVYIMAIPYTESLFFLLMVAVFYGVQHNKRLLIFLSLFLLALTRASAIFLFPAMLVMELVGGGSQWVTSLKNYIIYYATPLVAGTALFVWYQHYKTGLWFAYFIQQQKYEGHEFKYPTLPFTSLEGPRNMWISALAIFCCVIAIAWAVLAVVRWLSKKELATDKVALLSCLMLGVTLYKTMFYNPTWGTGTTLTIGINRYVFATPFFYVFLHQFINREVPYNWKQYLTVFIICNAVWLTCGSYLHILAFLHYNFLTGIVMLYMLLSDKRYKWPAFAVVALNMLLLTIIFQQFLTGLYLD